MNKIVKWTLNWTSQYQIPSRHLKTISSTNDYCKTLEEKELCFVLAENQTHGRGRNKNKWIQSDFMSSFSWKQEKSLAPDFSLTFGKVLLESFKDVWPNLNWTFKEPNDIYKGDQKIAGVLIETFPVKNWNRVVLGIGINVLKAPLLSSAGCIGGSIDEKNWHDFLTNLYSQIMKFSKF